MNKDSIIGMLLLAALFIGYAIYTQPTEEQIEAIKRKAQAEKDSIALVEQQEYQKEAQTNINANFQESTPNTAADTNYTRLAQQFDIFASSATGKAEEIILANDLVEIQLNTKGGVPQAVKLDNYKTYGRKNDVFLFKKDSSSMALNFFCNNRMISTNDLYFKLIKGSNVNESTDNEQEVRLRLEASSGKYIDYIYRLKPNSYMIDFDIELNGLDMELKSNRNFITFNWMSLIPQNERGPQNENKYSQIYYKYFKDETGYLSNTGSDQEELTTKVKWVAFKDQFFSSILIAKNYFLNAELASETVWEKMPGMIKKYNASLSIPFSNSSKIHVPFQFYFGPNDYTILKNLSDQGDEENLNLDVIIDLGWGIFGWINRFVVITIFNFLSQFISNYGIIILLLTIIIKAVLFPFTFKSYMSTAKQRVLKPEVDKINEKISKDKAMERQQATMALYRKAGVNPMGGCLPMLLQMPILFAMFRFFPVAIQLRQKPFLWATDLSSYDSVLTLPFTIPIYGNHVSLFTLLMTISTMIYTKMQNSMNPQNNSMPGMQTMMYIMPIMFLVTLNSYSSGLSYYYLVANIITFSQMFFIKRMVDEKKVLAKLKEAQKRPAKKKSGFQARLEKMAQQQREAQKNRK